VLVEAAYTMTVCADNGLCNSTHEFAFDPLSATLIDSGVMGNVMCTHGSVGQGTIALGAAWHYAQYLSLTVGDTFWQPGNVNFNDSTYTVTCSLDTTDIFDYRTVTLNLQSSEQISQTGYTKSLVGGEPCIPDNTTVGLPQIATSAAANWRGLKEGQNLDGLFESILQVSVVNITALEPRTPPWAFNDSTNALEDVLGLTAALVLSRINSSTVAIANTYFVMATRIGSGKLYVLAFTIPCALSTIALGSFMAFSRSRSDRKYKTSSMRDLMLFGKNVL